MVQTTFQKIRNVEEEAVKLKELLFFFFVNSLTSALMPSSFFKMSLTISEKEKKILSPVWERF